MPSFGKRPRQNDPVFMEEYNRSGRVLRVSWHSDDQVMVELYGKSPKETFRVLWLDTERFYGNQDRKGIWRIPSEDANFEPEDRVDIQILFDLCATDKDFSYQDMSPITRTKAEKLARLEFLSTYLRYEDDPRWDYLDSLREGEAT